MLWYKYITTTCIQYLHAYIITWLFPLTQYVTILRNLSSNQRIRRRWSNKEKENRRFVSSNTRLVELANGLTIIENRFTNFKSESLFRWERGYVTLSTRTCYESLSVHDCTRPRVLHSLSLLQVYLWTTQPFWSAINSAWSPRWQLFLFSRYSRWH